LRQSKGSLPQGTFIMAVSVVSPFIKFKNASKETIDAAEELVEEIRRGLMKAGQKLSRHLKREKKAEELTNKIQHIESFAPILVDILCRIVKAPQKRKDAASQGLQRILDRDMKKAQIQYDDAAASLEQHLSSQLEAMPGVFRTYRDPKEVKEEEEAVAEGAGNAEGKEPLDGESEALDQYEKKPAKKSKKKATRKKATKKKTSKKKATTKKKAKAAGKKTKKRKTSTRKTKARKKKTRR
jgi:DNA topoisomerase-6 subunit B